MDKLLSVKETSKILGVHHNTIYRWIKEGSLSAHSMGGSLRISEQQIQEFLKPASYAGKIKEE